MNAVATRFQTTGVQLPSADGRFRFYCYLSSHSDTRLRNNCVIVTSSGAELSNVVFYAGSTRRTYTVASSFIPGLQHFYLINGLNASAMTIGSSYNYNFQLINGSWAFAPTVYIPGDYSWDGTQWILTPGSPAEWAQLGNPAIIPRDKLPNILDALLNQSGNGQSVTAGTLDNYGGFNTLTPNFKTNLSANAGMLFVSGNMRLQTLFSNLTINLIPGTQFEFTGRTVADVNASTAYAANMTNGVPVYRFNVYNSNTLCGTHTMYFAKDASSNLGYYWHYDGDDCSNTNWAVLITMTKTHLAQRG